MGNFSIKVDLLKLKGAKVVKVKDQRCILIPTELNKEIFVGEKGAYLNITSLELRQESTYGDTHFLKGNLPRAAYDAMTEEERRNLPIIGNMRPLGDAQQNAQTAAEEVEVEDDDLPF